MLISLMNAFGPSPRCILGVMLAAFLFGALAHAQVPVKNAVLIVYIWQFDVNAKLPSIYSLEFEEKLESRLRSLLERNFETKGRAHFSQISLDREYEITGLYRILVRLKGANPDTSDIPVEKVKRLARDVDAVVFGWLRDGPARSNDIMELRAEIVSLQDRSFGEILAIGSLDVSIDTISTAMDNEYIASLVKHLVDDYEQEQRLNQEELNEALDQVPPDQSSDSSNSEIEQGPRYRVRVDDKWGYIDQEGEIAIQPSYTGAGRFSEVLALVEKNGKRGYIDKTGKEVIPLRYDVAKQFREGRAAVKVRGRWGYIDREGNEIAKPLYDDAKAFSEGLAAVKFAEYWRYIDRGGTEVLVTSYKQAWSFSDGLAMIIKNKKWGYIDRKGEEVISSIYAGARPFSEGLAVVKVKRRGKWGYIDRKGEEVISSIYDDARSFENGMAMVKMENKWGYLNSDGERVVPFLYDDARPFSEGLAMVKMENKWGYIDQKGEMVIPATYDDASPFENGMAAVCLGNEMAYINEKGSPIWAEGRDQPEESKTRSCNV